MLGATRTEDVKELIHARQSVVVHAKAYGLQAIDMVYINFKGMNCICKHISDIFMLEKFSNIVVLISE